ncbi:MAG: hypothetical protein AAGN64_01385 [Bacteroidota bacterium]
MTDFQLPKGVTGFWFYRDPPPVDPSDAAWADPKVFRQACHIALRELGGRVLRIVDAYEGGHVHNFHAGFVEFDRDRRQAILCNLQASFVCFSSYDALVFDGSHTDRYPLRGAPEFEDCPELAATLTRYHPYTILSAELLNTRPTAEHLVHLGKAELKQFRYWKPDRLGDVIFNRWD